MSHEKFELLKELSAKPIAGHAPLKGLKHQTSVFIDLHNQAVSKIWKLKNQLEKIEDFNSTTERLLSEVKSLEQMILDCDSEGSICKLLERIKETEMELTGDSDIGQGKPFSL